MVSSREPVLGASPASPRSSMPTLRRVAGVGVGLLLTALLPATAVAGLGLNLDQSASGTTVSSAKGAAITITLESNASTGYHWIEATKPDPEIVATDAGSGEYVAPDTTLIGAAGKQVFTYHAAGDGTTTLVLDYVAPGTNAVGKSFALTIKVGPVAGMLDAVAPPPTSTSPIPGTSGSAAVGAAAIAGLLALLVLRRRFAAR